MLAANKGRLTNNRALGNERLVGVHPPQPLAISNNITSCLCLVRC